MMSGSLANVVPLFDAAGGQTPALWWTGDRSWLVSTEVDSFSTYVGGTEEFVAELLASHDIEAVPSRLDAPLDWGGSFEPGTAFERPSYAPRESTPPGSTAPVRAPLARDDRGRLEDPAARARSIGPRASSR